MYFANNEHLENYKWLMQLYALSPGKDLEYEANIYIAAYPEIFKCFRKDHIDLGCGPLADIFDDERGHNAAALTGSTIRMVDLGMSLYNDYQVSVAEIICAVNDEKLFDVCIEAIRIRAGKYR